jgi:D-lactate dehydrogenase (cytochrome)
MGETLISTSRLNRILEVGDETVRVQAGVTLAELDAALAPAGKSYPPAPTFMGACVGGIVATNAAGARTFKYGSTRGWVRAVTVVLPSGEVLDIERGHTCASAEGVFELAIAGRTIRVPVPNYRMPEVTKLSAGYYAAPGMDLIDLFIGSEGTLGVITEVTLRLLPSRPATFLAFMPFSNRAAALALVKRLLEDRDLGVSAIEHMDRRCLALLREEGVDRRFGVSMPESALLALLVTQELPPGMTAEQAFDEIGRAPEAAPPDTPLARFCVKTVQR